MPVVFYGHGSPTNTLDKNRYTEAWARHAARIPRPRAILVVSAHYYVPGLRITAATKPATIHDFSAGFAQELFEYQYPVEGSSELVERVTELLAPAPVEPDYAWGIDHGAYSVLAHTFPNADVPVVVLSIDRSKPAAYHYALAQKLAPLRDEGIFIMGSGNVVHNLELADFRRNREPYVWARRFEERLRSLLVVGDHEGLVNYHSNGNDAILSVPTPDHYLPFVYVLATQRESEPFETLIDGFEAGSLGMLSVALGL